MAGATAQDGTGLDLDALFRRERDRLHAMCLAILRDQGDAEDAVQETFARVAGRLDRLDGDPVGYLVVVARNVCRAELRRRARRVDRGEASCSDPTPEDTAVHRGLLGFVWRRLARVEQALITDIFSGLSLAEIGARDGASGDAVAQRVSRLRRRIRHMVAAPAALLLPAVQGSAMGRALSPRLRVRGLLAQLIERAHVAEQAMGAVLAGVLAGVIAMPPSAGPSFAGAASLGAPVRPASSGAPATRRVAAGVALPGAVRARISVPTLPPPRPAATLPPVPRPPDTDFTTFTAPADDPSGRVVFAWGGATGCAEEPCTQLWRTDDGGATWQPLWSTNFAGGQFRVVLPPGWPADPTIFGVDLGALYRSDDGGRNFRLVARGSGAALDPTSQPGDARFFVGGGTLSTDPWGVYTERDDTVHPLPGLPSDTSSVRLFTTPESRAVYLDVETMLSGDGGLYTCPATSACVRAVADHEGVEPAALSPAFESDHTWFTWTTSELDTWTFGAPQAVSVALPAPVVTRLMPDADYAETHGLHLVLRSKDGTFSGVRVVGRSVLPWRLTLLPEMNVPTLTRLPDGHLMVGLNHAVDVAAHTYTGGGTLCSVDDGLTWTTGC